MSKQQVRLYRIIPKILQIVRPGISIIQKSDTLVFHPIQSHDLPVGGIQSLPRPFPTSTAPLHRVVLHNRTERSTPFLQYNIPSESAPAVHPIHVPPHSAQ